MYTGTVHWDLKVGCCSMLQGVQGVCPRSLAITSQSSQPIHCAFSISCEDLQYYWEPLHNYSAQPILRMHSPTPIYTRQPAPMHIIDFVRAKVVAGGELGAKVASRVPLKWLVERWDRSPYSRRTPYSEGCYRRKYGRISRVGSSASV